MSFVDATKNYFTRWLDFKTRSSRSEYWWGYLGSSIVGLLGGLIIGAVFGFLSAMMGWTFEALDLVILPLQIYLLIAGLSLSIRRLHDINKSGWWLLIILTLVGIFVLFYWYCKKGDEVENRFGSNPLENRLAGSLSEEQSTNSVIVD